MKKIIECVPNFSEGRNQEIIDKIVEPLKNAENVNLVNVESDSDYNRTVVTVFGEPQALKFAVAKAVGVATELIDLNHHSGEHQRMGATDVIPFIPISNTTTEECVELSKEFARLINEEYGIPVFLYEDSATKPERVNLANIRRGEFEGMSEKLKDENWKPDYGEAKIHPTAGVSAVGARFPLVAYNIDLDTTDIHIANSIAKAIRHSSGGFRYIKAGGVELKERGITQVTMNITNYQKTSIYRVFETVKMEAKRCGVNVLGSEIIGLVPLEALVDSAAYYLGLYGFSKEKIIENRLMGLE